VEDDEDRGDEVQDGQGALEFGFGGVGGDWNDEGIRIERELELWMMKD